MSFGRNFLPSVTKKCRKKISPTFQFEKILTVWGQKKFFGSRIFFLSEKAKNFGPLFLTSTQFSSCNKLNLNNFFSSFNRTWVSESWRERGGGVGLELRPPHFRQILGLNWSQLFDASPLTNGKLKRRRFTHSWARNKPSFGVTGQKIRPMFWSQSCSSLSSKYCRTEVTVIVKNLLLNCTTVGLWSRNFANNDKFWMSREQNWHQN